MILEEECIGCMINQIYKALRLLDPNISKEKVINAQQNLMKFFVKTNILHEPGPFIGQKVYKIVAETLGVLDPYKELKEKSNLLALEFYDIVEKIVNDSEDPLFEAIAVSALGNTIDYGAHHDMDLIRDIKNFSPENLKINDIPEFKKSLEKASQILILGDNAGEIVFDKLLVITLKKLYPKLDVIYSVRAGPIINDATMEDAKFVGLTQITKVIESPDTPGIELSIASDLFKEHFLMDDGIILSKGQGNFESLYLMDIPNKDVYYLLKAKCVLMERIFNVDLGTLIFKKKVDGF